MVFSVVSLKDTLIHWTLDCMTTNINRYIAKQYESCKTIARKFHMDAAKIVHNNRCVDGLSLNAKLLKGTPLYLREIEKKDERCITPTSVFGVV